MTFALNQRVVLPELRIGLLAVCMPHMDKQCSNFNTNDLSLDTERQRIRCAWALYVHIDWTRQLKTTAPAYLSRPTC